LIHFYKRKSEKVLPVGKGCSLVSLSVRLQPVSVRLRLSVPEPGN